MPRAPANETRPNMLDRITLSAFRNHRETRLDGAARFNLLVGENGAGKTNVLEALSLVAPGRGLRRAQLSEMALSGGRGGFAVSAGLGFAGGAEAVALGTGADPAQPTRRLVQVSGARASGGAISTGWRWRSSRRMPAALRATKPRFANATAC